MALGKKKAAPEKAAKKADKEDAPAKKAKKAKGAKKAGPILFKAPADFKPAFFEISFETLRDGLIRGGSIEVQRVKGKWDNPDAKRFNLAEYDIPTLTGIATRLGAVTFAPNVAKRLLPKTQFKVVLRVGKKADGDVLTCGVKGVGYVGVSAKSGKAKTIWLSSKSDGNDVQMYRKIRKLARVGAGAFVEVLLPPSGKRSKKSKEESED